MQSLLVLALITLIGFFAILETKRNSAASSVNYAQFKADAVAGNIQQYNDLLTQYLLANYDTLHMNTAMNPGSVEQITLLDYQQNQIAQYSQKNLVPFLNYTSVSFNYTQASSESMPFPTLYLATSWSSYAPGVGGYRELQMPEIMGITNQIFSKHVFQGNSVYWTIPWLLQQDGNCNLIEAFGQIPDINRNSQLAKVKAMFNLFCLQIQANSAYRFQTYVYMAPVFLSAN